VTGKESALAIAALVAAAAIERPGGETHPWVADQGDGTYRNPVLFGDYSDPDVIRVGTDYYLVASSFQVTPGLPILRSRDLVSWTIAGHALAQVPGARYARVQPGAGIWAPALREHGGTFFLFAPTPDEGIYVLTAARPEGPWSAPRLLLPGAGLIDPCPFWDDDGRAYLVHAYAYSRSGIKHRLRVRPMAPDASAVLGEGKIVFDDPVRHPTLEGPKLYKRNGWYYILAPAGGVERGWQVALRARDVYGPYEDRIVLAQGPTPVNGPHQGALVDTAGGAWWFVHFQEARPYGRIVHLQPVIWRDDWPVVGAEGRPVLRFRKPVAAPGPPVVPQTSDELDAPDYLLGPQWQWNANHDDAWASLKARPGHLRLAARPVPDQDLARAPHLLLQKLPARSFTAETLVELHTTRAGLVVMGKSHAALTVTAGHVTLWVDNRPIVVEGTTSGPVRLQVSMQDGGRCRFAYQDAGMSAARDIGPPFQAREGVWIGARVGIFAEGAAGWADFDYFRFRR
jgi:beta-xylosidase